MKPIYSVLLLLLLCLNGYSQSNSLETSYNYLEGNIKDPQEYIISKFKQYDYVFLGEYHRNKQDVDFVESLIPHLYENGVRNIVYEFYKYSSQATVDSLLTAKEWNQKLLYSTLSNTLDVSWGYTEYLDLFKKVWEFNQTLSPEQPQFRIVLMGTEYYPCKTGIEVFGGVDPDLFMANVLEKEVIAKEEKALVYCGRHHAFTKYRQPIYNFTSNKLEGYESSRLGNIIYQKYPSKAFLILLHAPLTSNKGWDAQMVKPADGVIDSLMVSFKNKPMGFDVKNTVIGQLRSTDTYYALGYPDFKLEDMCDGYIFLLPYNEVKFVSVDRSFYDDSTIQKLKEYAKCKGFPQEQLDNVTIDTVVQFLTETPEIHYGDLVNE